MNQFHGSEEDSPLKSCQVCFSNWLAGEDVGELSNMGEPLGGFLGGPGWNKKC